MICEICNNEINPPEAACPVCGASVDPEKIMREGEYPWTLVYTTNTLLDAEMIKANLESAGTPVVILSQADSTRMFTVGGLAVVKVYAPEPFAKQSAEIIRHIQSGETDSQENAE